MIPSDIRAMAESLSGTIYIADKTAKNSCLARLGIDPNSEFHTLFAGLVMGNMFSPHCLEQLAPIADATGHMNPGITFAWEVWGVPQRYIAITSLEGEGGYFYDRESGQIVDFELAHRDAFLAGDVPVIANGAFDFFRWYLAKDSEPRGYAARSAS